MDLYILGIGGTFMGHLALLARQLGLKVSGCDANVYSPMKEMLDDNGIEYDEGYDPNYLRQSHALYVIGNTIGRGNPMIEMLLNEQRPMVSGPQWLYERVLKHKWVIAIAGTHGKTTTTSMVAWILSRLGRKPGYLIGGAAKGFEQAACLGDSDYFVIEADEYDTAFFDKRSKFIHYRPKTVVLNNLEFDHADIFASLDDIKRTMHHLVRTVPMNGRVIYPAQDSNLAEVLQQGCWSEPYPIWCGDPALLSATALAPKLIAQPTRDDASSSLFYEISPILTSEAQAQVTLTWDLIGQHNLANGLAAVAAVSHLGISVKAAVEALRSFPGVARRMDLRFEYDGIHVYDDFAHHPTAITTSLEGLRAKVGQAPIIAFLEPRSNTMTMGVHKDTLVQATAIADSVYWLDSPKLAFDLTAMTSGLPHHHVFSDAKTMLDTALAQHQPQTSEHWLCMSNGAFGGLFGLMEQRWENTVKR